MMTTPSDPAEEAAIAPETERLLQAALRAVREGRRSSFAQEFAPGHRGSRRPNGEIYRHRSLKRPGASSAYLTVCVMLLCPRYACNARVSRPRLVSA